MVGRRARGRRVKGVVSVGGRAAERAPSAARVALTLVSAVSTLPSAVEALEAVSTAVPAARSDRAEKLIDTVSPLLTPVWMATAPEALE